MLKFVFPVCQVIIKKYVCNKIQKITDTKNSKKYAINEQFNYDSISVGRRKKVTEILMAILFLFIVFSMQRIPRNERIKQEKLCDNINETGKISRLYPSRCRPFDKAFSRYSDESFFIIINFYFSQEYLFFGVSIHSFLVD